MKFKSKKYLFNPLIISLLLLALSPAIPISNQVKNHAEDNLKDEPKSSSNDNSIINTILDSFGLENRVFADCSAYGSYCWISVNDVCVPEGVSTPEPITSTSYGNGGSQIYIYPVSVAIQNATGITISPLTQSFNNYPSGTPNSPSVIMSYNVTGPAVSVTDDPGDSSGPYSGLGRKKFSVNAHAGYRDWSSSTWGSASTRDLAYTINVDHVNTAPTVGAISPEYSSTVANSSTTTDIPVNVTFNDIESNHMDVVVELSNDNFSTILQTHTFSAVDAGTALNYTFTGLATGSYKWRATATETDAVGTCGNDGDNLQTVADPEDIILTVQASAPAPAAPGVGSVNAPTCPNQKPGAPSGIAVTPGPNKDQKTLSWFAAPEPVTDYSIAYSDSPSIKRWGVVSTGKVTKYTISGLGSGKYYFWVNAVNGCMPGDVVSASNSSLPSTGPDTTMTFVYALGIVLISTGILLF